MSAAKPHIWQRYGNWHCGIWAVHGVRVECWPRGVGATKEAAYADYLKRRKEWK